VVESLFLGVKNFTTLNPVKGRESMNCKTPDDCLKFVKDEDISYIQCWFTDVLGTLKSFTITPSELDEALQEGMGFDGSSIEGFARIEESDLIAKPDPSTLRILPWEGEESKVAGVFCDILQPDQTPYDGDPRYVLKRFMEQLQQQGYKFFVGPELEFFYFKNSKSVEPIDNAGYFDSIPLDLGHDLRKQTVSVLQQVGIQVEYEHHEVAPSQQEIDLRYNEAMIMADHSQLYRVVVKEVARQNGVYATFMPKPIFGQNGSGMHVHQSLFKEGRNAFYDADDEFNLSTLARHYIAGLLKHAPEITAVCNQVVNSYKRLVPGYEAPAYISWARRNRSTLVRVPMYKPGKENATRVEFRSPDPAANPYLAYAVMAGAGLEGIENKYELPDPIEEDIFEMTPDERGNRGIGELPGNLYAAIIALEKSDLVKKVLGEHIFNKFVENKKIEWNKYRVHVSQYEIDKYLPVL